MEIILAVVIGVLFGGAIYMMLRRSMVKLIIGLGLLGHAANLLIFTIGGFRRGAPPILPDDAHGVVATYSDPVPQALILTAIVIGFGAQAFAIVLVKRLYMALRTDDIDRIVLTDAE